MGFGSLFGFSKAAHSQDMKSARAAGYRMPLESDPHDRTFMQWPSAAKVYGGEKFLYDVQDSIADIANAIAKFEPVVMLANPDEIKYARKLMDDGVELWPIEAQDLWCRDAGPTFVVNANGKLAASELNFNGWGGKQDYSFDGKIVLRVATKMGLEIFDVGVVGEGGGVETDGAGTLMAHESSWVNKNRNKGSRDEIEKMLLESLGAETMIWAPGIAGADITDYHIDALARFVKPGQVVIQLPDSIDHNDPWSVSAFETYEILKQSRDANGNKLDIVVLPTPDPETIRSEEEDFVSSYVNYYVCNGAVIGAQFGDDAVDAKAAEILGQLYPGREIVSLDVDPIGEAGGGIHCATQQQPKSI